MASKRAIQFCGVGLLLALGAPAGWLGVRVLLGAMQGGALAEFATHQALYLYLLLGSAAAFGGFGARMGHLLDRLEEADARHARESITDGLTGLYNPRYFQRRFSEEVSRASRSARPLALVLIDLDHFKRLNDTYGHQAGDHALIAVGKLIHDACRASDVGCRTGGEEFAILCPETTVPTALALAERLREDLEALALSFRGQPLPLTASFGVGEWAADEPAESLFERVDAALYQAKASGRNRVEAVTG
jgi:diguanylate cyclase (GGDEF)-like protein